MLTPLSDDRKWTHGHSAAIDGERRSVGTARPLRPIKGDAELLSNAVPSSLSLAAPPAPCHSQFLSPLHETEPPTPLSISFARPSQLDCFDGEQPHTLLYLSQAAPIAIVA